MSATDSPRKGNAARERQRASALASPHRRKPPQWPSDGMPEGAIAPWLAEAMRCSSTADLHARNAIFKSRTLMRKAVALVDGDADFARAMAQTGRAVAITILKIGEVDRDAARQAALRRAAGTIGHGHIKSIGRAEDPSTAVADATIPAWPLPFDSGRAVNSLARWDGIALAKAASGLSGKEFSARHGVGDVRIRKCVMVMKAARALADGCKERASKIITMSESQILAEAKAARNAEARRCHLDEKEENGRTGSIETPRDR